jgi:hypothetical protein
MCQGTMELHGDMLLLSSMHVSKEVVSMYIEWAKSLRYAKTWQSLMSSGTN